MVVDCPLIWKVDESRIMAIILMMMAMMVMMVMVIILMMMAMMVSALHCMGGCAAAAPS